ncbi:MAG: hypothetical protein K0M54_21650, partial [Pseudomonas sp.]|uniref:hypothetical protein n=1 Tax=Pseudomonas sp. TaxID=306 RepID=UPI0025EC81F7
LAHRQPAPPHKNHSHHQALINPVLPVGQKLIKPQSKTKKPPRGRVLAAEAVSSITFKECP